jgi:hypothetical protein
MAKGKGQTEWIVSRSLTRSDLSRGGIGLVFHIQARTADQFCSFATLASEKAPMTRGKAADGKTDIFTCMSDQGHTTFTVVGRIRYQGEWPAVPAVPKGDA